MLTPRVVRGAALVAGALGGLTGAAYGLLSGQSRLARRVIGIPTTDPLQADGLYLPDGSGPYDENGRRRGADGPAREGAVPAPRPTADPTANTKAGSARGGLPELVTSGRTGPAEADSGGLAADPRAADVLTFAVIGDSSAAGLGVSVAAELPGVLMAIGLAEESERPVLLRTHAVSGSTSLDLAKQIDAALIDPPDVALIIIGANDVTTRLPLRTSIALLGVGVERLHEAGVGVVVGTCPDLGAIRPIAQPLRAIVRNWSLALSKGQRIEVERTGGIPVPLADLLSPEFLSRPAELFSADNFHPSAAGYEAAAAILLPALCSAAGVWDGGPLPRSPIRSSAAEARRPTSRIVQRLNRRLGRPR
ncbi:lysophospholipase L1-like esterase [Actinoalloteichus hoggarensis]|uniref:GDSL-like Lipase/Acylhydrolase n=1 Tax=Actinoalloteichus hoggarensis TaxID=1470176 RepID=A0A221VYS4_9PSEU|nr:SGNH/GDSL hydrolase family protein [Actinoalloteichus hoggarensis]ASO18391.1 GDSL-like Lipase/Acylhydrolase [Actinoalloteichus hoggarensis]MBB5921755.1 lysophospholipase L1-like esterase [Actinoalloteichus hoggarensis]